jgi:septin family protein
MRILLCGLSGTGKTTIGNQLADRGWTHFDCELEHSHNPLWLSDPIAHMPEGKNVVASWGFIPHLMETVWDILDAGYLAVWLQGSHENRLRSVMERGETETFLEDRVRLRQGLGLQSIEPDMVLNTFRPNGSRWDVASLIHSVYWTV